MLQINIPEKKGFDAFLTNSNFKCAFITSHAQYSFGRIKLIKRHNDSDEVYVLLRGKATVVTTDNLDKEFMKTNLEYHTSYNVKAGTWHYLAVSDDAIIFVAESGKVAPENTDTEDIFDKNIIV